LKKKREEAPTRKLPSKEDSKSLVGGQYNFYFKKKRFLMWKG